MAKKKRKSEKHDNSKSKKKADENTKLGRKEYESELTRLQAELVKLQEWVVKNKIRVIIIFERRDAAGKGGVIRRIVDSVSHRVFRVVALPTPSEVEKTQIYGQRYIAQFPAGGEIVLFDRSWYNRAGVERVMGFCTKKEYERFLESTPIFEKMIVDGGTILLKYWLEVGIKEQERRIRARIGDPRKTWKLSPMDLESYHRWYEYSKARDEMFAATDTGFAPWFIVPADDKKRARLNCISHILNQIPYKKYSDQEVKLGKRNLKRKYDDKASMANRKVVPQKY
ncbi:MAG: polyphosphate kinase 2 [Nitrospirales bacterium]|nr:polyphosphate kinase 2 [Nitrospirales bacterium]